MKKRPWAAAFDRAEKRPGPPRRPRAVIADWLADEIWSLKWAEEHTFGLAQAELATRLAVARLLKNELRSQGLRGDRAAAEAVAVIDLVGSSEYWSDVVAEIRP